MLYENISTKDLEQRFQKNLEFFKKFDKYLVQKLEQYEPNADLIIENNLWNIFDEKEKTFLYPKDGRLITFYQLANWLKQPFCWLLAPASKKEGPYLHTRYLSKISALREQYFKNIPTTLAVKSLPFLIIAGVGLGLHVDFLLRNFDIENLLILEPNEDFFYISLHLLDWRELLEPKLEKGLTAQIVVGEEVNDLDTISIIFDSIPPIKLAATYVYIHYTTSKFTNLLKQLTNEITKTIGFLGFFDDEIISLKHTLENIKNNIPIFIPPKKPLANAKAAAVVGSGPSLEELIPYLKKFRKKLFIISCGTALGILEKHGITPDLHVSIERNKIVAEAIEVTTSEAFRKNIPLLAANNNHPYLFQLFDKKAFYLKAADCGASLFDNYPQLYYTNPTVTNTGLAIAAYLKFEKIFLFGVDLAFPNKKHHASGSFYDTRPEFSKLFTGEIEVEANFGGTVLTNFIFYSSLRIMSESIEIFKSFNKSLEVFNPNKGAKIKGAQSITGEELEKLLKILPDLDINKFFEEYWKTCIKDYQVLELSRKKMQLMTNFFQLKQIIMETLENFEYSENPEEVLMEIYAIIRKMNDINRTLFLLLHGTFNLILSHIWTAFFMDISYDLKINFLKETKRILIDMLEDMEKELYNLYEFFPA